MRYGCVRVAAHYSVGGGGVSKMMADTYVEMFLFNKNVDSLVRVLQRMEALGIWSRQEMTVYEVRLEELRASLNAEFAKTMIRREHRTLMDP
jgi:hypothetical protein